MVEDVGVANTLVSDYVASRYTVGGSATMTDSVAQFAKAKYLNLETFRKDGTGVRTPVWFAEDPGNSAPGGGEQNPHSSKTTFYVYTLDGAAKVKRIRNNPKARIAPCTMRGAVTGAWIEAHARICENDEAAHGQELLRRKYGLLKIIGDFFSRLRGRKQAVIAIEFE